MLVAAGVRAQPAPPAPDLAEAQRLFEEGRELSKEKRWAEACERFQHSYQIDPSIGTTLNLADCHEHLGQLREAWRLFDQAAQKSAATTETKRTAFARERADAAGAKLAVVVVRIPQPVPLGLAVRIAGREVAIGADARDRVDPGDVEIIATMPGKPRFATTLKATAGATVTVDLPTGDEAVPPTPVDRPVKRRKRVAIAWTLGGLGAASAIGATLLTITARSTYQDIADGPDCMRITGGITCNDTGDRAIADAQRRADLGTVFAIGAVALVGAGTVIYLTAPRERAVQVAPVASREGGGVVVRGRF